MSRVLITGAGGFVGHHFLEHVLTRTRWDAWDVVATDSFRHKGKTDRISEVLANEDGEGFAATSNAHGGWHWVERPWSQRTEVLTHDLTVPFSEQAARKLEPIDYMVCFASESHVDRSISDPVPFVRNNVDVALNTLELARRLKPKAVVWVSTDEVYGPVEADDLEGHPEWDTIMPSNPYSASKAAQEALAFSYWRTYGVPLIVVNCMNMIGERQDAEKFVPLVLSKVMKGEEVTIHGTPDHIGTRHYLHARNLADGITFLLDKTTPSMFPSYASPDDPWTSDRPDRYNIACPERIDNLTMAQMIAGYAGKELKYRLEDFHSQRPGHDPHYGLSGKKMEDLGWTPPVSLADSLKHTIQWTQVHPSWLLED